MTTTDTFNEISAIHAFIMEKERGNRTIKRTVSPSSITALKDSLRFKLGDEAETVFLLKEDVFVELGAPKTESVAFIALTRNAQEIQDGQITLIGPDIPESEGKELNFGQVMLLGGAQLEDLKYKEMERALFHLKNLEGFMIRAVPNKLWSRISKDVGRRGFSFETLGKALMIMYKEHYPLIETMEILFMTTDSSEDFLELKVIGTEIRKKYLQQYSAQLKTRLADIVDKQRDDCEYPWSCDECDYNEVCDEIRDIVAKMKAYREKSSNTR
jgi:CO dehydrogenase/acetyl-CoA synthase beta subunit